MVHMVHMGRTVRMVHMGRTVLTEPGKFMKSSIFFGMFLPCLNVCVFAAVPKAPNSSYSPPMVYNNLPRTKAGVKRFLMEQCVNKPLEAISYTSPGIHMPKGHLPAQCEGKFMSYRVCQAVADKKLDSCAIFKKDCGLEGGSACEQRYYEDLFLSAAVSDSPGAVASCLKSLPSSAHIPSGQRERLCSRMVQALKSGETSPRGMCNKMGMMDSSCLHQFAYLEGPQACDGMAKWGSAHADHCKDMAAIVHSKGHPSRCGDSAVCRSLLGMGQGDVCASLKTSAMDEYCSGYIKNQFKNMIHQEASFRHVNHLPPYKDGDKFLNFLPLEEREKYYNKKQERAEDGKHFAPNHGRPPAGASPPPNSQE